MELALKKMEEIERMNEDEYITAVEGVSTE